MLVPTIGIEVHVELKSKSKMFSSSSNNFNDAPNTNISEIDLAYPGVLPRLNKEVINMALKAALVLNCKINKHMHFDRKNYFYPDLPKGYQITQARTPIGIDGYVEINIKGKYKKIEIERIHMEEDTCKSIHALKETLLNYNRAGVPLIEIVTKPVIESDEEAILYLEALREKLLYLGISDVKIEEGSMRCDANVSLKEENSSVLGTKTEIKNIGSITNVGTSILYEITRQKEIILNGGKVKEETRRFDDKSNTTILMRSKETGNDYRYFPDPDIPYIDIDDKWINEIHKQIPILPDEIRKKYLDLGLNMNNIKTIIGNKDLCDFYEQIIGKTNPIIAANLLTGDILSYINKNHLTLNETKLVPIKFIELIDYLEKEIISSKQCKDIIPILIDKEILVKDIIKTMGFYLINDNELLNTIIQKVIENNPASITDYKDGKDRAVKFLMGQIMKESQGRVNPKTAMDCLIETLNNL
ncbi:MAG: Asp-tRNA(Asn)/Glu-tRNA(Gln) amidotransferase subunit GatB [Bacilli bacterium]